MGKSVVFGVARGGCGFVQTRRMLPVGADAVVMVEYTQLAGGYVGIFEPAAPGAGMVDEGEDLRKGELFCAGTIIRPQEIGALAAAGIISVPVFVPLEISIISTGDELIPPENKPKPGEARDVNSFSLKALAARHGYRVKRSCAIADNEEAIGKLIVESMKDCDIVFISGGSSQGEKDLTASVIDRVSAPGVFTHGLAIKPGKPTILGWDEKTKTLLAGLPGHPVSAMMVFETLFGRLQEKIFGIKETYDFPVPAEMACNVPGSPGKTTLLPVMLRASQTTAGGITGYVAEPVFGKSGMIVTLTRASGYVVIDLNKEGLKKGEQVFVNLI
jgi:molybdopterin molybdotransferase